MIVMRQKVLAWLSFGECTARVKLELTDFSSYTIQWYSIATTRLGDIIWVQVT